MNTDDPAAKGHSPRTLHRLGVMCGEAPFGGAKLKRRWWETVIVLAAIGIFIWLALGATHQQMVVSLPWMIALVAISLVLLLVCGITLWRRTRFS